MQGHGVDKEVFLREKRRTLEVLPCARVANTQPRGPVTLQAKDGCLGRIGVQCV